MTKQRKYQLAKLADGLCSICGKESLYNDERCLACYVKFMVLVRRRAGCKPWRPGGRGRPPLSAKTAQTTKILEIGC